MNSQLTYLHKKHFTTVELVKKILNLLNPIPWSIFSFVPLFVSLLFVLSEFSFMADITFLVTNNITIIPNYVVGLYPPNIDDLVDFKRIPRYGYLIDVYYNPN